VSKGNSKKKVWKKLYTGDLRDLAQAVLSEVIAKALSAIESGLSKSLSKPSTLSEVEAYVMRGIENYCNTN
tara:strand:+ start:8889 stop:9101 length:213 start_codon:yes stop_codon:yes gene_type:complete